jgi:transposase
MKGAEFKPYVTEMDYMFPPSLADFLGTTDEVHIFREVTEHLDISQLDSGFNGMGQHPYHPLMLLRVLMWGMANRVVSTRRIEVLVHRDVSFIYLAGGQRPDYRTLARFRRQNAAEIERLFQQSVILCARLGMVNLGHIALDGTKIKANTSKHKAMSYGRMKQEEARLKREIEELMKQSEAKDKEEDQAFGKEKNGYNLPEELKLRERRLEKISQLKEELEREKSEEQETPGGESPQIEDKEQRSFADYDGRIMLMKSGGFDYAYNGQMGAEESHGVIVVADLTNDAVDIGCMPEMVAQVRELRKELEIDDKKDQKTTISADNGYFSADNIRTGGKGIELLIASGREKRDQIQDPGENRIYPVNRFYYDKNGDVWRCPGDHFLSRLIEDSNSNPSTSFRYICADCNGCSLKQYCLKPNKDRRVLEANEDQLLHGEMRARLLQPEKQAIYRKRKWLAEQNIAQIKDGLGFRGITMRGKVYARAQWLFACAVHNVMKAVRFLARKREATMQEIKSTMVLKKLIRNPTSISFT